jgi:hypothetical protein
MKKEMFLIFAILVFIFNPMIMTDHLPKGLAKKIIKDSYWSENGLFTGRFILRYKNEINISPIQEEKIQEIMLSFEEAAIKKGADIKIKELRLTSYIKSDEIDRDKVASLIKDLSNIKAVLVIDFLNYLLNLRQVLSDKQLEKLKSLNDISKSRIKDQLLKNNFSPNKKK